MASKMKDLLDGGARLFAKRPERAALTQSVQAELVGTTEVSVTMDDHSVTFDEPALVGGTNKGPNPTSMTLGCLAACEAIIYRMYSERLEIPFKRLSVTVDGDLDLRGGAGFADIRAGFSDVRMTIRISGPASDERYEELHEAVAANCPVLDTIANPVHVVTTLDVVPT